MMMMMMTKEGAGSVTQLWDALPAGGAMELSSHSLFLLQQLNVQREFGFLCDCTVAIGNVYFKAHRAVLAAFSNYFKMIFIHQSSECIKIQPTDIQPDVFSYLLHIMYTGTGPKQQVEQSRLQEGVRFLHAYPLFRAAGGASDSSTDADAVRMSNLYGIQISSQPAPKDCLGGKAGPEGGREVGGAQQERAWMRPSPVVALEPLSRTRTCSVASGDDSRVLRVKQECEEAELIQPDSPPPQQEATPSGEAPRDGRVKLVGIGESAIEGNSPGPPQLLEEVPPYGHNPTEDPGAELRGSRRRKIACGVCSRREPAAGLLMRCHRHHPHLSQVETKEEEPVRGAQDNGSSCYSLDSEISQESSDTAVAE